MGDVFKTVSIALHIRIGRLQTKVAQVTRNGKFTQNGVSYIKTFLLHAYY